MNDLELLLLGFVSAKNRFMLLLSFRLSGDVRSSRGLDAGARVIAGGVTAGRLLATGVPTLGMQLSWTVTVIATVVVVITVATAGNVSEETVECST